MIPFSAISRGVLFDTIIAQFVETDCIKNAKLSHVQPASIDILPDLNDLYQIDHFSLPCAGEKIENMILHLGKEGAAHKCTEQTLVPGNRYLVRVIEQLCGIPFYARMNPKSSPGRVFLHSRLLTDGHAAYDEVYPQHQPGAHWMILVPKCDEITLDEYEPVSQLRFFKGNDQLSYKDIEREMKYHKFINLPEDLTLFSSDKKTVPVVGGAIGANLLSVDLRSEIVAYKMKKNTPPVILSSRTLNWRDYFEVVYKNQVKNDVLILEEGVGYLFGSLERIRLPMHLAGEVVPYTEKFGEFRSHFAGFIDCGFGLETLAGNSITFEVIAQEAGIAVRHGQPVAEIRYEYMSDIPKAGYTGNYKNQLSGPQLPKYFAK